MNYFGQGSFILRHPEAKNILFEMIFSPGADTLCPFLILSIFATIVASQAMISGMFSLVYQGITTHIIPLFKVDYIKGFEGADIHRFRKLVFAHRRDIHHV